MFALAALLMLSSLPSEEEARAYNQAGVDILGGLEDKRF